MELKEYSGNKEDKQKLRLFLDKVEFWDFASIESFLKTAEYKLYYIDSDGLHQNGMSAMSFFHCSLDFSELLYIGVDPSFRRKGMGHWLLKYSIARIKSSKRILLEVSHLNRAAINLYENFGFKMYGKREKYYSDQSDALLMEYQIENI